MPTSYICHYGLPQLEELAGVDWALVQAGHFSAEQVAYLHQHHTQTFAYLALSQEGITAESECRPWHLRDQHGRPIRNANWPTWLVDCNSAEWHAELLNKQIPALTARGFQGLFLDTLDIIGPLPSLKSGLIALIKAIHQQYPALKLIANRGFELYPEIHDCLAGVLFEAFTTAYTNGRYATWDEEGLAWTTVQANLLRTRYPHLPVLALDYADPNDEVLRQLAIGRARAHGFVPFVTDWRVGAGN
ncbi:MAG: endo alpha-1,4 polygalactosaminidase [Chloroflexi bacterium]|nr:endo alpha-1,4 polygalactosaminidase [Chloroflexota bacterium]